MVTWIAKTRKETLRIVEYRNLLIALILLIRVLVKVMQNVVKYQIITVFVFSLKREEIIEDIFPICRFEVRVELKGKNPTFMPIP